MVHACPIFLSAIETSSDVFHLLLIYFSFFFNSLAYLDCWTKTTNFLLQSTTKFLAIHSCQIQITNSFVFAGSHGALYVENLLD